MPVFISYQSEDRSAATEVRERLEGHHGIPCWMDVFSTSYSPKTITQDVLRNINKCTHLIALFGENTRVSWWVPYEVGVAEQAKRAITSFAEYSNENLPEYLMHWPILRNKDAVDEFAKLYKERKLEVESVNFSGDLIKKSNASTALRGAKTVTSKQFQKDLKYLLGQ